MPRRLHQCDFGQPARFRRYALDTIVTPRPRSQRRCWRWRARGFQSGGDYAFILGWRWSAGQHGFSRTLCQAGISRRPAVFGAAAACAKLLELSADGIANAIRRREPVCGYRRKSSDRGQECQSATPRAAACLALLAAGVMTPRRAIDGPPAGRAPWETNPTSNVWLAASARAEIAEYLQALSGRDCFRP